MLDALSGLASSTLTEIKQAIDGGEDQTVEVTEVPKQRNRFESLMLHVQNIILNPTH